MKVYIVLIVVLFTHSISAQTISPTILKDTQVAKLKIPIAERNNIKPLPVILTFEQQTTKDLQAILDKYRKDSNTTTTWSKINWDAYVYFNALFKAGKLMGTKEDQAFFIKTGIAVTTSEEIKKGIKVLQAGFAYQKPAEFSVVRLTTQ
jgi:hypothetical protein